MHWIKVHENSYNDIQSLNITVTWILASGCFRHHLYKQPFLVVIPSKKMQKICPCLGHRRLLGQGPQAFAFLAQSSGMICPRGSKIPLLYAYAYIHTVHISMYYIYVHIHIYIHYYIPGTCRTHVLLNPTNWRWSNPFAFFDLKCWCFLLDCGRYVHSSVWFPTNTTNHWQKPAD